MPPIDLSFAILTESKRILDAVGIMHRSGENALCEWEIADLLMPIGA
jgi:hypothetical protein